SRDQYTAIKGNGKDVVTLMVYMCGTDLESKHGMASSDISEMAAASYGDNVNVVVCTGGCSKWKTSGISSSTTQIYQIKKGKLVALEKDNGAKSMTDPKTLSSFISYCAKNFPADRNQLILWDHGGGSVSGFGYDENYKKSGSMGLAGISQALKEGGVKFDFVGFDACLMATAETALMLNNYADYMIASEETEPGIGWYYTNWLTKLGSNTSMSTLDIGKIIIDDFITACGRQCPSSATTLSITDLAEFANTVPSDISGFSRSVSALIENKDYKSVSDARYATREFAAQSRIDQVDLADLASNMGTEEGKELAEAIKGAVKYNRTSASMSNAYGISIYFPYKRTSYVDTAVSTYGQIGMDDEYTKCIKQFAKLETSGQIAAGGTSSPVSSLFGGISSSSGGSLDTINQLIGAFMGGSSGRSIAGLDDTNTDFMNESTSIDAAEYVSENFFDPSNLTWTEKGGKYSLTLSEDQWELVHDIDANMYYDDGEGYIDLGLDNTFELSNNKLTATTDRTWLSIEGQPVAYYHTSTFENGDEYIITGYVPVLLNGDTAKLQLVFTNEYPEGRIAGIIPDYTGGETDTIAKAQTDLTVGDKLDFICDYYTYDGEFKDKYKLGKQVTVTENMKISDTDVGDGRMRILYRFTDIYDEYYWSEPIILE
ncbi:MAG: peptidase C11, partial [Ruminococcus sp.]|nr:peptidase C11 [Ruminococcus sp.]